MKTENMSEEQTTVAEFIKLHGISMTTDRIESNPNMEQDPKNPMDHWLCTLKRGEQILSVPLSMGMGHHGKAPKVAEVLDCLASDAAGVENAGNFEDWCGEYGYDTDSRKAEKTYNACKEQTEKLKKFINSPASYEQLLWNTERL